MASLLETDPIACRRTFVLSAALFISALLPRPAVASDLQFHAYADLRLVVPSEERSWTEGGLGKLRFDDASGSDLNFRLAEIVVEGTAQITPELTALTSLRYAENQRSPVDALEAYVRYRPVSTDEWRWSAKVGAFFPPISLENDEIGWTSPWTLTPSAINTWIGEELRTIGAEGKVEMRGEVDNLEATAALFGWNDPAGVLIADRGWAMHDRPTALFDRPRLPDAFANSYGFGVPLITPMFKEIDDRAGWYGSLSWRREDVGRLNVLRYDNRADPTAVRGQIAWRTEFWSLGADTQIGDVTILAQALTGETEIAPFAPDGDYVLSSSLTKFDSAYILAGWTKGDWRLAARGDVFRTRQLETLIDGAEVEILHGENSEHGYAFTLAATWVPYDWLRLTGETLFLHNNRPQREIEGLPRQSDETQSQLSARVFY